MGLSPSSPTPTPGIIHLGADSRPESIIGSGAGPRRRFDRRADADPLPPARSGWLGLVSSALPGRALSLNVEERRPQDETRDEHHDDAGCEDADQRPPLRCRGVLPRLDHDPYQEPGGDQGQDAGERGVPGVAEDTVPIIRDNREPG